MSHDAIELLDQTERMKELTETDHCLFGKSLLLPCSIAVLQTALQIMSKSGFSVEPANRRRPYQKPRLVLFCSVMKSADWQYTTA